MPFNTTTRSYPDPKPQHILLSVVCLHLYLEKNTKTSLVAQRHPISTSTILLKPREAGTFSAVGGTVRGSSIRLV